MRGLRSEFGAAVRGLRTQPAFSALAVGVFAIGLGCVLYVAGMINGLILEPLPFPAPEQLYDAGLIDNDDPLDADDFDAIDANMLLEWREHTVGLAQVAGVAQRTLNLSDGERPERFDGAAVTANLFPLLGVQPALGRNFRDEDEIPGASPVVLLSDRVWRERYLSDPAIVGREVRVNARPARVIGVMPARFAYPYREQVWIPARLSRDALDERFMAVLRRAPDASEATLRAALASWFDAAMQRDPQRMRSAARAVGMQPLAWEFVDPPTRVIFWGMGAAVLLVLAIACANVTNLLLTQMAARRQELWLRGALGASRLRLALHLLAQTSLLALLALAVAVPLSQLLIDGTLRAFESAGDGGPPAWMSFDVDGRMLACAAFAAAMTAALTALLPAWQAGTSSDRDAGARVHSGRGFARASRVLVVAEVALSCALLIAAAVMVQAIVRLDRFDLGLDTSNVLTARIGLVEDAYPDAASRNDYVQRLRERLQQDAEVESVTFSSSLPGLIGANVDVLEQGLPRPEEGLPNSGHSFVDQNFAATMGARLQRGRWFNSGDFAPGRRDEQGNRDGVIVVDETFARRFVPGADVLGKRFALEGGSTGTLRYATVVGVLAPVQMDDIDDPVESAIFEPMRAAPRYFSVLVRTRGEPKGYADGLVRAAAQVDAETPAYWVRGYDAVLNEAVIGVRMLSRIFSGLGLVALALAAAGLYGVVAFAVAQRTREIGVRRALGAPDARVLGSVASRSLWQVGLGLGLGLALGVPFAGALAAPIGHVARVGSETWMFVLVFLALVATLAVWLPARRALKVDPMSALRHD
jgi:putative ABC transport system permease protein